MTIKKQEELALKLLEWHGGQSSGLYAVGSCMLSDAERGVAYVTKNHRGHHEFAFDRAITELRNLRADANFPEAVTKKDEMECHRLVKKLVENFV